MDFPARPLELDPLIAEAKRRANQRRVLVAAALLLVAGVAAGLALALRSPGGGSAGGASTAGFRDGLSVRYPGSLTRIDWCWPGLHVMPIALFTNARPPTCNAQGAEEWPPAQSLGANQVSVFLSLDAIFPAIGAAKDKLWNGRIDGRPAVVQQPVYGRKFAAAVSCPAGDRREYRSVRIKPPRTMNEFLTVAAVICGPNLGAGAAQFRQVARGIRFQR